MLLLFFSYTNSAKLRISFHNNSEHQYTIKVYKKINNLKSRNFEDHFMRNH